MTNSYLLKSQNWSYVYFTNTKMWRIRVNNSQRVKNTKCEGSTKHVHTKEKLFYTFFFEISLKENVSIVLSLRHDNERFGLKLYFTTYSMFIVLIIFNSRISLHKILLNATLKLLLNNCISVPVGTDAWTKQRIAKHTLNSAHWYTFQCILLKKYPFHCVFLFSVFSPSFDY